MTDNIFVGKGLTFPIELTEYGKPILKDGVELIRSSINIILSWPYGTRFYLYDFGSRLEDLIEEPNDDILKDLVRFFVIRAINSYESRIDLLQATIERVESHSLSIRLTYKIINTEVLDSFIFPFYRIAKI